MEFRVEKTETMKKIIMILFLLAGLSTTMFAQGKRRQQKEGSETITYKQKKSKKQMAHFEKQKKDKKMAYNGTNYRKSKKYTVDGDGFKGVQAMKKDNRFGSAAGTQRVRHQKRLIRTVYAAR
jgi:hypothetical protein